MPSNVISLDSDPGIQRDGTQYDTKKYIDGQWVRFYKGRPLKMGGYTIIDSGNETLIRTVYNYDNPTRPNFVDTYLGRANSVAYITFDLNGASLGTEIDRTPTDYITGYYNQSGWGQNSLWDFDVFTSAAASSNPDIVAHVAPNANDVSNTIQGPIYFGQTNVNTPLQPVLAEDNTSHVKVSGGIVYSAPLLIAFDNDGLIRWCNPGVISGPGSGWSTTGNHQTIGNSTKILQVLVSRGSAQPQLLAWTDTSIISLTYTGDQTAASFAAVTLDNDITVMSPRSIIGYANQFFWIGINQFFYFNGVVRTLPNTVNSQFFFQNINLMKRAKVWAELVNPGTGNEIWWHWPAGDAEECNHVIIYHIDTQIWFDTALSRSAGASAGIFPRPIMADNVPTTVITRTGPIQIYPLWMHEYGYDKVTPTEVSSIDSYFETHIYDLFENSPNNNRVMRTRRIEPNFQMNGDMTVTVNNRFFPSDTIANGQLQQDGPYTFNLNTTKIDAVNSQGRLVSFRFESSQIGGSYQLGKTLLHYNIGDVRPSGSGSSGTGS